MKIIHVKNYKELSKKASEIIINEIKEKPNLTIGFATGKSPKRLYKNLVKAYRRGDVDFSRIKTFDLDEYYPVERNNKKSYYYYMHKNLFNKINVKKENIRLLDGSSKNPDKECKNYEDRIKKNPIDIQILGIGVNGHIAFNEPGSSKDSKTRLVELDPETIKRNKFLDKGLTMGISTILKSKKIILLASGKEKANAVLGFMNCKETKSIPATFLKKHKNLIVIIDKKASLFL